MHCVVFGSIPGLCPVDASSTHASLCDNQKCLQLLSNVPWGRGEQNCPQLRTTWLKYKIFLFSIFLHVCIDREGLPHNSVGKESACNAGDPSWIPGSGRSAGEGIGYPLQYSWASLVVQLVKNPPAKRETWVPSLGWEDPLHSSILTWTIQSMGLQRVCHDWATFTFIDRENNSGHRRNFPLRYKTIKQTKTNGLLHTVSQLKQSKCESGKKPYPGILTK